MLTICIYDIHNDRLTEFITNLIPTIMTTNAPTTRRQKLDHVFDVLALSDAAKEYLTTVGTVTTITRLIHVGDDWFGTAVTNQHLSTADTNEIIAFKVWYWTKFLPEDDIVVQLTDESWEDLLFY